MTIAVPLVWWKLTDAPRRIGMAYPTILKAVERKKKRAPSGRWEARVHGIVAVGLGRQWLATSGETWPAARHAYCVKDAAAILSKTEGALRRMLERKLEFLDKIGIRARRLPSGHWRIEFGRAWTSTILEVGRG